MKTENTFWRLRRIIGISNTSLIDLEIFTSKLAKDWFDKTEEPDSWDKFFKDSKTYDLKI